jgi:transposase
MNARRIVLHGRQRDGLLRLARTCRDPNLRVRYLIVVHSADGWTIGRITEALGCCASTVSRTRRRWRRGGGEAGLADGRADNGRPKVDRRYLAAVRRILRRTPPAFGHRRPTWTLELLARTARRLTRRTVSVTTMGRVLARLGARRGRPKPVASCPWSKRRKDQRLALIRRLVASLPPDEAAVWLDQVQLDLNPRVGYDWMLPGTQRRVMTPGRNVRRFICGAMDACSGRLTWVAGERNDTALLLALLEKLLTHYPHERVIHVILDNYAVHGGKGVRAWLDAPRGRRVRTHFLPPYCPDDNRIERCVWRELHRNVTVNHRHGEIESLMDAVTRWIDDRNRALSQLRKAI